MQLTPTSQKIFIFFFSLKDPAKKDREQRTAEIVDQTMQQVATYFDEGGPRPRNENLLALFRGWFLQVGFLFPSYFFIWFFYTNIKRLVFAARGRALLNNPENLFSAVLASVDQGVLPAHRPAVIIVTPDGIESDDLKRGPTLLDKDADSLFRPTDTPMTLAVRTGLNSVVTMAAPCGTPDFTLAMHEKKATLSRKLAVLEFDQQALQTELVAAKGALSAACAQVCIFLVILFILFCDFSL
jgi:hypothetical protein